tara:strand:+ start:7741 stop:8835 length:1095 start_codon:yes stop_codon:yes gene_type:complete
MSSLRIPYLSRNFILVGLTIVAFFIFTPGVISANPPSNADLKESYIFQGVETPGDVFIVSWYDLPAKVGNNTASLNPSTDWCSFILDQSGCVSATSTLPVIVTNPEGLPNGNLYIRFKDNTGTVKQQKSIRRITNSLSIIKIAPGHSLDFTNQFNTCLESEPTGSYNWTTVQDCETATLSTETDQNKAFGEYILNKTLDIQLAENFPSNTFISNDKITPLGQVSLISVAYSNLFRIAPQIFQTGAFIDNEGFSVTNAPGKSARDLQSDQEIKTNQTFLALENLSQQYFGIQATTFLTVIFITLGVILGVVMFAITKSEIFTGLGFFIPLALGMNISSPISSWTFGLLLVLGVATAMVMGKRWIS